MFFIMNEDHSIIIDMSVKRGGLGKVPPESQTDSCRGKGKPHSLAKEEYRKKPIILLEPPLQSNRVRATIERTKTSLNPFRSTEHKA
jgi:hypothetical protein